MADDTRFLINRIKRDLARLEATITGEEYTAPLTGWRMVRGSHALNYLPDPEGRDVPPDGYGRSPALEKK